MVVDLRESDPRVETPTKETGSSERPEEDRRAQRARVDHDWTSKMTTNHRNRAGAIVAEAARTIFKHLID